MKFGIMSDLHMDRHDWDFAPMADTFYICAGDVVESDYQREKWLRDKEDYLFYINGNHDYYNGFFDDAMSCMKTKVVDGIKIAGATLWTDLSNPLDFILYSRYLIDYRKTVGITQEKMIETHLAHKKFLFESEADIIVSHHCPSALSIATKYRGDPLNCCFTTDLTNDILSMKKPPKLWIHGHTHEEFDYMIGETRVVCHPRGYWGEQDWYSTYQPKIVEI